MFIQLDIFSYKALISNKKIKKKKINKFLFTKCNTNHKYSSLVSTNIKHQPIGPRGLGALRGRKKKKIDKRSE